MKKQSTKLGACTVLSSEISISIKNLVTNIKSGKSIFSLKASILIFEEHKKLKLPSQIN